MKIDERGFDDHAGFIDGRYTRDSNRNGMRASGGILLVRTRCFNALINDRRIEASAVVRSKIFTSDDQPRRFGCQRVLRCEIAGCDLTLPETVVELQSGGSDPERAIADVWSSYPLVFLQVHADRLKQSRFVLKSIGRPSLPRFNDHLVLRQTRLANGNQLGISEIVSCLQMIRRRIVSESDGTS